MNIKMAKYDTRGTKNSKKRLAVVVKKLDIKNCNVSTEKVKQNLDKNENVKTIKLRPRPHAVSTLRRKRSNKIKRKNYVALPNVQKTKYALKENSTEISNQNISNIFWSYVIRDEQFLNNFTATCRLCSQKIRACFMSGKEIKDKCKVKEKSNYLLFSIEKHLVSKHPDKYKEISIYKSNIAVQKEKSLNQNEKVNFDTPTVETKIEKQSKVDITEKTVTNVNETPSIIQEGAKKFIKCENLTPSIIQEGAKKFIKCENLKPHPKMLDGVNYVKNLIFSYLTRDIKTQYINCAICGQQVIESKKFGNCPNELTEFTTISILKHLKVAHIEDYRRVENLRFQNAKPPKGCIDSIDSNVNVVRPQLIGNNRLSQEDSNRKVNHNEIRPITAVPSKMNDNATDLLFKINEYRRLYSRASNYFNVDKNSSIAHCLLCRTNLSLNLPTIPDSSNVLHWNMLGPEYALIPIAQQHLILNHEEKYIEVFTRNNPLESTENSKESVEPKKIEFTNKALKMGPQNEGLYNSTCTQAHNAKTSTITQPKSNNNNLLQSKNNDAEGSNSRGDNATGKKSLKSDIMKKAEKTVKSRVNINVRKRDSIIHNLEKPKGEGIEKSFTKNFKSSKESKNLSPAAFLQPAAKAPVEVKMGEDHESKESKSICSEVELENNTLVNCSKAQPNTDSRNKNKSFKVVKIISDIIKPESTLSKSESRKLVVCHLEQNISSTAKKFAYESAKSDDDTNFKKITKNTKNKYNSNDSFKVDNENLNSISSTSEVLKSSISNQQYPLDKSSENLEFNLHPVVKTSKNKFEDVDEVISDVFVGKLINKNSYDNNNLNVNTHNDKLTPNFNGVKNPETNLTDYDLWKNKFKNNLPLRWLIDELLFKCSDNAVEEATVSGMNPYEIVVDTNEKIEIPLNHSNKENLHYRNDQAIAASDEQTYGKGIIVESSNFEISSVFDKKQHKNLIDDSKEEVASEKIQISSEEKPKNSEFPKDILDDEIPYKPLQVHDTLPLTNQSNENKILSVPASHDALPTDSSVEPPTTMVWSFYNTCKVSKISTCKMCELKLVCWNKRKKEYNADKIKQHLRYQHPESYIELLLTEDRFLKEEKDNLQRDKTKPKENKSKHENCEDVSSIRSHPVSNDKIPCLPSPSNKSKKGIWAHFEKNSESKAICKHCSTTIYSKGTFKTTLLMEHMKTCQWSENGTRQNSNTTRKSANKHKELNIKETVPKSVRKTNSKSKMKLPEHKAISLQNECIEAVIQELEITKNDLNGKFERNFPRVLENSNYTSCENRITMQKYSTINVQLVISIIEEMIFAAISDFAKANPVNVLRLNTKLSRVTSGANDISKRVSNTDKMISEFVVSKFDFNISRSSAKCLICFLKINGISKTDGLTQHLRKYHLDVYDDIFWKANSSSRVMNNSYSSKSLIPTHNNVSQSRVTLTDDLIDIELAKCGVEDPQNVEHIYKLYLMEIFGLISESERDKRVKEAELEENQHMIIAHPLDENAGEQRMKAFKELLKKTTFGTFNWLQINNCLKASVLKGYIHLIGHPCELDMIIYRGYDTNFCPCNSEFIATLKDVLYQPDCGDDGNFIDNKVSVKCSCKTNCQNPYHGTSGAPHAAYVSKMCVGTPVLRGDQYHKHCKDCPNFGTCFVDTHQKHCLRCGAHYYSNKEIGYPCPSCEPHLRNLMMLSDEPLKCKNAYDHNLLLSGKESAMNRIY